MTVEFDHPRGSFAPYQELAHGKSTSVDSGRYVDRNAPTCAFTGGAVSSAQTDAERFAVTFHRVK